MHVAMNKHQCYSNAIVNISMEAYVSVSMQIVGKHYCQEASFQVRFGRSKISLDIPEDGKVTKEGWRITPSTHPTVSDTEHCMQESLLSSFAEVHLYTLSVVLF